MRARNVADARQKLELVKAAKVVAARVAVSAGGRIGQSEFSFRTTRRPIGNRRWTPGAGGGGAFRAGGSGGGFRSGGIKQRLGTSSIQDARSRISKKVVNARSTPMPSRSFTNRARIGGQMLENFKITAKNEPSRRNRLQRMVSDEAAESLTRTIRNDRAVPMRSSSTGAIRNRSVGSLQMDRSPRILNSKKGGSVFLAALQDIEKIREESNEIVIKSYNLSVFDRLAPPTPSKSAVVHAGYRVIVTNLNPAVSEEDVEELFSTIGPLIVSGLKRPGIGYANFARLPDAKRAVSEYNNRELDGVPMKCVVENDVIPNKPKTATAAAAATTISSPPIIAKPKPFLSKPAAIFHNHHHEMVAGDDEAMEVDKDLITQALFSGSGGIYDSNGSTAASGSKHTSSVQFTVKI